MPALRGQARSWVLQDARGGLSTAPLFRPLVTLVEHLSSLHSAGTPWPFHLGFVGRGLSGQL